LDLVRKRLEGTTLVKGGIGPVFFKLNDGLEAEGSGNNLWLEDPNEVGGGGFCEVNDYRLWGNQGVGLLTNSFSKREAGKTLF
jgi:hypothetical protein